MDSFVISLATVATVNRASPAQASMVAPFTGLKSTAAFPVTQKTNNDIASIASKGGRVQGMQVWPPLDLKKFDTLSYLPLLIMESLGKEVENLLDSLLEIQHNFVYRLNHKSLGYYNGRYWAIWKLPMFGCTNSSQVLKELEEYKKVYPNYWHKI